MYWEPCNHEGTLEPDECIKLLIDSKNKNYFLVGTQDEGLKIHCWDNSICPIIFMHRGVLTMDAPSEILRQRALIRQEQNTLTVHDWQFLKKHKKEI